jgi:DNA-binding transcriptional LysR family regulator
MTPTERALELEPLVREALARIDRAVQPRSEFTRGRQGVFRIMASDYAESTLCPAVLGPAARARRRASPWTS